MTDQYNSADAKFMYESIVDSEAVAPLQYAEFENLHEHEKQHYFNLFCKIRDRLNFEIF